MVDVAGADVVAVLTRAPSAGGKSRLFAGLARPPAPGLLTALLLDTLEAAAVPEVVPVVAVEPATACSEVAALVPESVEVLPQEAGSLGDRMHGLMDALLTRGARAAVLIGSDLPDLAPQVISAAFAQLRRAPHTLVLGPAADGGYYLIGATRTPPVFDGIAWGSQHVLAETMAAAADAGLQVHLLDSWCDVDTPEDLRRVVSRAGDRADGGVGQQGRSASRARRTCEWARAAGLGRPITMLP